MKRYLVVLALLVLNGCAAIRPASTSMAPMEIDNLIAGGFSTRPAIVEFKGKPAFLYATKDDRVALQIGDKKQLLDDTARVKGGRYFMMNHHGQNLDAMWWSHQDGKNLYFTTSKDGGQHFSPVNMVNNEHGVLPPFSLVRDAQGVVGVTYLDERQPGYQVYFNRSTDGGHSWSESDQRLDKADAGNQRSNAQEPQNVALGDVWFTAWTEEIRSGNTPKYQIVSRRSVDKGLTWSEPKVIYTTFRLISSMVVRAHGDSVVIAGDDYERGIFALTSQDKGGSWRDVGFVDGTNSLTNSGVDMALAGGRATVVWIEQHKDQKPRIMRASLDVAKSVWLSEAQRLDRKAYENTQSILPSVMATAQGVLIASWIDYRDIRPNIYVAMSSDYGQVWTEPQALLKAGEISAGWPQLIPWGEQAAIAYETYSNDSIKDGKLIFLPLTFEKGGKGLSGLPEATHINEAERKARLEQRVKTLWSYRVEGNFEPTYDMFDFAYKLATTKKMYVENVGVITYLSFSLEDVTVSGNEAKVKLKVKYEVKPTMLPTGGKPLTVPPVEIEMENKWVWVGSDWYMVIAPAVGPQELKY